MSLWKSHTTPAISFTLLPTNWGILKSFQKLTAGVKTDRTLIFDLWISYIYNISGVILLIRVSSCRIMSSMVIRAAQGRETRVRNMRTVKRWEIQPILRELEIGYSLDSDRSIKANEVATRVSRERDSRAVPGAWANTHINVKAPSRVCGFSPIFFGPV